MRPNSGVVAISMASASVLYVSIEQDQSEDFFLRDTHLAGDVSRATVGFTKSHLQSPWG